jgi:hypothetical protein
MGQGVLSVRFGFEIMLFGLLDFFGCYVRHDIERIRDGRAEQAEYFLSFHSDSKTSFASL